MSIRSLFARRFDDGQRSFVCLAYLSRVSALLPTPMRYISRRRIRVHGSVWSFQGWTKPCAHAVVSLASLSLARGMYVIISYDASHRVAFFCLMIMIIQRRFRRDAARLRDFEREDRRRDLEERESRRNRDCDRSTGWMRHRAWVSASSQK